MAAIIKQKIITPTPIEIDFDKATIAIVFSFECCFLIYDNAIH
tara:strand:- start:1298 stop:1426 length:129 start_codon:yes stop_codon:yes gene_type:complete